MAVRGRRRKNEARNKDIIIDISESESSGARITVGRSGEGDRIRSKLKFIYSRHAAHARRNLKLPPFCRRFCKAHLYCMAPLLSVIPKRHLCNGNFEGRRLSTF